MPEPPPPGEPERTVHASSIEGLEHAWRDWRPGRRPPCWYDFLPGPGEPCSPERVFHLVQLDVEFRARAGLSGLTEVRHFLHPRLDEPDARLGDEQQVELIRWEYQQRWKSGDRARREDYQAAFPRHAAALADLRPRWACPACRRPATAEDEDAPSWRCPRCDRAFAPAEVFPPRTPPRLAEAVSLPSPGQGGTVPDGALPPPPRPKGDPLSLAGLDPREYELLDQLGAGGMGEVYRGRDPGLGRDLAVKVMRPELRGHREAEGRFLREARVTGALQHPGIVPVHNVGRLPDGRLFFTMKLVRGRTLERLLAEGAGGRPDELLGQFEKVCQAVAYAHSRRVIHRDLKPANVMVGRFGEVQVMDWGLAKVLSDTPPGPEVARQEAPREPVANEGDTALVADPATGDDQTVISAEGPAELSRAGGAMGTPAFMPPEQACGRLDQVDERADVFSLGAILCVLLTGRPPYQATHWQELMARARGGDLAEAMARLDGCGADGELVALCRECLAIDRDGRPRHAGVVAERLAAYQTGVQERLRQAELERAHAMAREQERRKRQRLAAALAAALLLLLAGGAAGLWWRQQRLARTDRAVSEALAEARLLHQQARADQGEPGRYREALAAARKAADLARTGGASAALSEQVESALAQLEQDEQAAQKDRQLQATLLEVRGPREGPKYDQTPDGRLIARAEPTADEQFASAFQVWGLDVDVTPTADAAARLRQRPPQVVLEAAAALNEWARERRRQGGDPRRAQRLEELAAALEQSGSQGGELRDLLARGRLPLEHALGVLSAALRPVPVPFVLPLEDGARLRRLAERADPATEPLLGLLTLVQALRLAGDDHLGERLLRSAVQARPQEVVLYQALGRLLAEQKPPRWRDAAECYQTARALRPELGASLAEALLQAGRAREGLALMARLAAERPDNPFVHFSRGEMLNLREVLDKESAREAVAAYRRSIALYAGDAKVYVGLGLALYKQNNLDEAAAAYQQAIRLDPGLAIAYNNLGTVHYARKDNDGAIDQYRKAIALDPKLGIAHKNLGDALFVSRPDEAMRCYRTAIDLDPTLFRAYYNLARTLHRKGELDAAIELYRLVLNLRRFQGPYFYIGEAYREKGDLAEALRWQQKLIDLYPSDPRFYPGVAGTYLAAGDVEGAIRLLRQGVAADPEYAPTAHALGAALLEAGQPAEAQQSLQGCLGLYEPDDPGREGALRLLQQCQSWLGVERQLASFLAGEDVSADPATRLRMARLAQRPARQLHATAARLYRDAFSLDPRADDDLAAGHRYNAACAAALAGCGRGKDADRLDAAGRAVWRQQALGWLRAELAAREKPPGGKEAGKPHQALRQWRTDPDLAGVRDAEGLSRLPAEERAAWVKFWAEVEALRGRR